MKMKKRSETEKHKIICQASTMNRGARIMLYDFMLRCLMFHVIYAKCFCVYGERTVSKLESEWKRPIRIRAEAPEKSVFTFLVVRAVVYLLINIFAFLPLAAFAPVVYMNS